MFLSKIKKIIARNKQKSLETQILIKNKDLSNSKRKDAAFLIATGPSIKRQNLKLLENADCFSVSNFFLHQDCKDFIKPILHFFAPYHQPMELDNFVEWLRSADKSLPDETQIVLGASEKKIIEDNNLFTKRKVYFLSFKDFVSDNLDLNVDITKKVQGPQTVPIMALPVLHYMGYKKIYLLGCDANVLKNYKQNVEHFFKSNDDLRKKAGSRQNTWSDIESNMTAELTAIRQYKKYNLFFKQNEVELINLSPESWLDFLQYEDFETAVINN